MCAKHADNIDMGRVEFYVNKPLLLVKSSHISLYPHTHYTVSSTYGIQTYSMMVGCLRINLI